MTARYMAGTLSRRVIVSRFLAEFCAAPRSGGFA